MINIFEKLQIIDCLDGTLDVLNEYQECLMVLCDNAGITFPDPNKLNRIEKKLLSLKRRAGIAKNEQA